MLYLLTFNLTGPLRRVDCFAPPSVCHVKVRNVVGCKAVSAINEMNRFWFQAHVWGSNYDTLLYNLR